MASCGSLQQIFENPLPENPTLIQSLSPWNQIKTIKKPVEVSSFTEIFGELQFKENHPHELLSSSILSSSASTPSHSFMDLNNSTNEIGKFENNKNPSIISCLGIPNKYQFNGCSKKSDVYSSKNSESLQLCTEGLGVESFDVVEESMNEKGEDNWVTNNHEKEKKEKEEKAKISPSSNLYQEFRRSKTAVRSFPPPISCIASSGKPWVCFKAYRQDGRFVLKEIRIPTQEFLHACREDGRLKLHFVHHDKKNVDEEEDTDTEEDEDADDDSIEEQKNETNKVVVENNLYEVENCKV